MAARKQASGVWEEEKGLASPPIADAFTALDHTREQKIEEEGRKGQDAEDVASALLTYARIYSVAGSRRAPLPPVPVAVTAFESCMLTMRAERGAGLRPPEKGRGVCRQWSSLALAHPGWSAGPASSPSELNSIAVPNE